MSTLLLVVTALALLLGILSQQQTGIVTLTATTTSMEVGKSLEFLCNFSSEMSNDPLGQFKFYRDVSEIFCRGRLMPCSPDMSCGCIEQTPSYRVFRYNISRLDLRHGGNWFCRVESFLLDAKSSTYTLTIPGEADVNTVPIPKGISPFLIAILAFLGAVLLIISLVMIFLFRSMDQSDRDQYRQVDLSGSPSTQPLMDESGEMSGAKGNPSMFSSMIVYKPALYGSKLQVTSQTQVMSVRGSRQPSPMVSKQSTHSQTDLTRLRTGENAAARSQPNMPQDSASATSVRRKRRLKKTLSTVSTQSQTEVPYKSRSKMSTKPPR